MELAELKKELHALIDGVDDKQVLTEMALLVEAGKQPDYEESDTFWNAIEKARQSIAMGKGVDNTSAREFINQLAVPK